MASPEYIPTDFEITARISDVFSSSKIQIKTDPAEELMVHLEEDIIAGEKGCVIEGNFRDGKNSAIRYCAKKFSEYMGSNIGWCEVSSKHSVEDKDKPFIGRVLTALGHEDPWSGSRLDAFDRLTIALTQKCDQNPRNSFVLWFDDVHTYRLAELYWIFDISNALDKRSRLYVLMTMPPVLDKMRALLRERKRGDIVQRFMLNSFRFRGLKTLDELKKVLKRFSDYSDADGDFPTFTQLFLLKTGVNYNLESLAEPMWKAFRKRWKAHKLELKRFELGMKWPCSATARILQKVHSREWTGIPTPDEIEEAIDSCGFARALEDWIP